MKDATPIKEEAHEEDSDDQPRKPRGRERKNTIHSRGDSKGSRGSLDRDSRGAADIEEDMRVIEEQSKSISNSVPLESSGSA